MSLAGLSSELDQLRGLLDEHEELLILGHKDADGDTLGCSLAFAEALRRRGKRVHVVIPPPVSPRYAWMPGFEEIVASPPEGARPGLVLFFDAGSMERTSIDSLPAGAVIVNVDHHTSNSRYGHLNLIDPEAAAVGQMCLELLERLDWPITPTMAQNLYTALLTDTGGFRHENTDRRALADAAHLAALGADPARVATMVYKSWPLTTLRLSGLAVADLQEDMDGRLAWTRITRRMLHEAGATMSESEGIIDTVNTLAGLEVAIVFKEVRTRLTKISVRTRGAVDAARLCERFGGGGHQRAAGAEIPLPLDRAVPEVLQAAREALGTGG